jgi:hypothetical protein
MVETDALKTIVDLLDKVTTIGILLAAWLWERRERTAITNMYIADMRRFARRGGMPPSEDDVLDDSISAAPVNGHKQI